MLCFFISIWDAEEGCGIWATGIVASAQRILIVLHEMFSIHAVNNKKTFNHDRDQFALRVISA